MQGARACCQNAPKVTVLFSIGEKEYDGDDGRADFRRKHRPPDAVHAEQKRQNEYERHLKHERSHQGKDRGNQSVIERGKESRRIDRRAGNPPLENDDIKRVQSGVRATGNQRYDQPEPGFFGGGEKALENILQHIKYGEADDDAPVKHAVFRHVVGCAQKPRDGSHHRNPERGKADAEHDGKQDQKRKTPV